MAESDYGLNQLRWCYYNVESACDNLEAYVETENADKVKGRAILSRLRDLHSLIDGIIQAQL